MTDDERVTTGGSTVLVRLQALAAIGLPWLIAHVIAPGTGAWVWVGLLVPLLFAARYAREPLAWLTVASGLVSLLAFVPAWLSALVAVAVAVVLLIHPPHPSSTPLTPRNQRVVLGVLAAVLVVGAVALATAWLVQVRDQNAAFEAAQREAEKSWLTVTGEVVPTTAASAQPSGTDTLVGAPREEPADAAAPVHPPIARLRFLPRDDGGRPVTERRLFVGPGVTEQDLAAGPGHYPSTGQPGALGNIAIAGHRTGWGSPFLHLDELKPGDRVRVTDRTGARHVYVVDSSAVVDPDETWVLGPDPLGTGEATLTLTTCDPPHVNTKRLVVFATLKRSVPGEDSGSS